MLNSLFCIDNDDNRWYDDDGCDNDDDTDDDGYDNCMVHVALMMMMESSKLEINPSIHPTSLVVD